jgi:hypothetical protein
MLTKVVFNHLTGMNRVLKIASLAPFSFFSYAFGNNGMPFNSKY